MSEKYKFELNDKQLEQVVGGCPAIGEDTCPMNLKSPSSSYCPTSDCGYYTTAYLHPGEDKIPYCEYYCVSSFGS